MPAAVSHLLRVRAPLAFAALLILGLTLLAAPAHAATITVDQTVDFGGDATPGDGVCDDGIPHPGGKCTLRAAIMEANFTAAADTIVLPAGTYTLAYSGPAEDAAVNGDLDITNPLTVQGAGSASTIVQAQSGSPGFANVFTVNPVWDTAFATSFTGLTIRYARNSDPDPVMRDGGALNWYGSGTGTLTIDDVVFDSNETANGNGGALAVSGGTSGAGVTITNSRFTNNRANRPGSNPRGGGIYVGDATPVHISDTEITGNVAGTDANGADGYGGGIGAEDASGLTIRNVTVGSNTASRGGGIWTEVGSGPITIEGSRITGNSAPPFASYGAGLDLGGGGTITDSAITGNLAGVSGSATGWGGGIHLQAGTLTAHFNRIAGNHAYSLGSSENGSPLWISGGTADVANNWWGCNAGPADAAGCQSIHGTATVSPWLTLRASAAPAAVTTGSTSSITADLLRDSASEAVSASNLAFLDGTSLSVSNVAGGTTSGTPTLTSGAATMTYTGTTKGAGNVRLTLDGQSVDVPVAVSATTDLRVTQSESTDPVVTGSGGLVYTITLHNDGPDAGSPTLSHTLTLPTGATRGTVTASQGTFTTSSATDGTWSVGSLASGASATLTVAVAVPASVANGATIESSATATPGADDTDPDSADATSSVSTGVVTPAAASVSPSSKDFGSIRTGTQSGAQTVRITNSGGADLTISGISLAGANPSHFDLDAGTCAGATVAGGDSCDATVRFEPQATGTRSAILRIASNDAGSPDDVALSGTGVASSVSVSPPSKAFGDGLVGSSATQSFTVTNSGTASLNVSGVTLAGADSAQFSVTSETCTGGPIAVNATCTLTVAFSPSTSGTKSAELRIASDAPSSPASVALSGRGVQPGIAVAPATRDFGGQRNQTTSTPRTVTVTNTGTAALDVTAVALAGANADEFTIESDGCTTADVAPNDTCDVVVRFAPTALGAKTATLQIDSDAPSGTATVTLSGLSGLPAAGLSPGSADYAPQPAGTASGARTFTLANTGNVPLEITQVALAGADAGDFAIAANACAGGTVAAGGSCTVAVRFAPRATGEKAATLRIVTDAAGSPHSVALTGRGLAPPAPPIGSTGSGNAGPVTPQRPVPAPADTPPAGTPPVAPGATGPGSAPAARARVIPQRRVTVRNGRVKIRCAVDRGSVDRCVVTVVARIGKRTVRIGSATIGAHTGNVRLNARGRALLKRHGRKGLAVTVKLRVTTRAGGRALVASRKIRLRR